LGVTWKTEKSFRSKLYNFKILAHFVQGNNFSNSEGDEGVSPLTRYDAGNRGCRRLTKCLEKRLDVMIHACSPSYSEVVIGKIVFQGQHEQKVNETPISTKKQGIMVHTCHPSHTGNINERITSVAGPGKKHGDSTLKITKTKRDMGMVQVEALSSNHRTVTPPPPKKKALEKRRLGNVGNDFQRSSFRSFTLQTYLFTYCHCL
jgi:hypothetical protein